MELELKNTDAFLDNVLRWLSMQSKVIRIKRAPIPISEIVNASIGSFEKQAENKSIIIRHIVPLSQIYINADQDIIRFVVRTLVSNALKFTQMGGEVVISYSVVDDFVLLNIQDNGIGMCQKQLERIFVCQIKDQLENGKGHGLGLSLCKKYLNQMGAEIKAESVVLKGTIFTIVFDRFILEL